MWNSNKANRNFCKQRNLKTAHQGMHTQISHIEAMERRKAEFVMEKAKEREFVAKEMASRMQLDKQLAEECQKNLKLEYEAKTKRLERELRDKTQKLLTIKESESVKTSCSIIQEQLRGNIDAYTSKIVGPGPSRGIHDKNASSVHRMPMAPTQVLPEMLPPIPTFTPGMTGPKPIVTAGMAPIAGNVTLLPVASFRTPAPIPMVESSVVTRGLVTATHTIPSVPVSLVAAPKLGLATPGMTNVSSGTTAYETVCSMPIIEVSDTTKQPQVTTGMQAKSSSEQPTTTPATQAKSIKDQPLLQVVLRRLPDSAPIVSAPIVVVKQPQPTHVYNGSTSWKKILRIFH